MNKLRTIFVLVAAFAIHNGVAQIGIGPELISSGGGYHEEAAFQLNWSVGEACISYSEVSELSLSEGLLQLFNEAMVVCLGDYNFDGDRNTSDLLILLGGFGCTVGCAADLNGDDMVNTEDLLTFLSFFGTPCPS